MRRITQAIKRLPFCAGFCAGWIVWGWKVGFRAAETKQLAEAANAKRRVISEPVVAPSRGIDDLD